MKKRIFAAILSLLTAISLLSAFTVSAAEPAPSEQPPEEGISDEEFWSLAWNASALFSAVYEDATDYVDAEGEPVFLERNGRTVQYLPAKEPYAPYSYWEDWARSIYTEDLVPYALDLGKGTEQVIGLLIEYEGKAYFLKDTPATMASYNDETGVYIIIGTETIDVDHLPEGSHGYGSVCWIISNSVEKASGGFPVINYSSFDVCGGVSLYLTVDAVKTEAGWRIQKGMAVDLFCPNHVSERSEPFYRFAPYQFLYEQVANQVITEYLKEAFGPETEAKVLKLMECSCYRVDVSSEETGYFSSADVIASSDSINGGKPFYLVLEADLFTEDWKVDLERSIMDHSASYGPETLKGLGFSDLDEAPIRQLAEIESPETGDGNGMQVAFAVPLLTLAAALLLSRARCRK